jgi:hypothetical protein
MVFMLAQPSFSGQEFREQLLGKGPDREVSVAGEGGVFYVS